ncbi:MAG: sialate O-acetylesterase, partial [Saprospiraceae bacterium]|nr:sialate O-acetylesterase [Saprospiraceae bacterium]
DIGDLEDIHPANKQDVGKRLALWALAKTYGRTDVVYSGPIFKSMEIRESKAIISFDYADNGLIQKGVNLREFLIAGADKTFHPAKAAIEGNTVVVSSVEVPKPVAVRFAFTNTAQPNLFNAAGLPASAFRTDDWEIKIE